MKLFPKRIIYREDGQPYLIRYFIFKCPWFRIRVHHILLSDNDCLHDHPWNFTSIILKGGYWEVTPIKPNQKFDNKLVYISKKNERWDFYGPGRILPRKAEWKHRLILPIGFDAWSLVFFFKRRREWGFWTKKGFVLHQDYISTQSCD